jgi:hypothetical protein
MQNESKRTTKINNGSKEEGKERTFWHLQTLPSDL